MNPLDILLKDIQENPLYPALLEKLIHNRPQIPAFDIVKQNEDDWKMKSSMQKGYDLCLSNFNIRGVE
jgi:hypothetical protein